MPLFGHDARLAYEDRVRGLRILSRTAVKLPASAFLGTYPGRV
jgi:hypothetical protein